MYIYIYNIIYVKKSPGPIFILLKAFSIIFKELPLKQDNLIWNAITIRL